MPAGDGHDPALAAELSDRGRALRGAVATLPRKQRQVIHLAYFHGLSYREVSLLTGLPLGTVKTRARAAFRDLRLTLQSADEYRGRKPSLPG